MNYARRSITMIAALLAAAGCSGCQKEAYTYVFLGVIKNAADGAPIENAEIGLNDYHDHMGAVKFPVRTDKDGRFEFEWRTSEATFIHSPPGKSIFILQVKKSGYHSESIDLGSQKEPESSKGVNQIIVLVQLRPESE